ncbi:MAG: hypothetical protein A2048_01395 [Deltaproteobacteria bacterium GWA2_45_12]|nr:MAG: hypothetical protein A2048_01395 [Deltaproteobacteria bacterium GWA2_45_12]
MTISFNQIPNDRRVPFVYIEFDNTRAVTGPQTQPYKILHIGQKIAAGSKPVLVPVQITSVDQAADYFGNGSILHRMLKGHFDNNTSTEVWALPLNDDQAAVKATGTLLFAGPATESGTLYVYIGGDRIKVGITSGDTGPQIATALKAALDAATYLPITATINNDTVTVTAKNGGDTGNFIDLRHSYYDGEKIPSGVTLTITPMAAGAGNPDVDGAFTAIGSEQYNVIVVPYTDQSNLTKIDTELSDRWGPITQNDGFAVTVSNVDYASLVALGNGQNSEHLSIAGTPKFPTLPWQIAGALGAIVAYYGSIDPARPFQTLALNGVLPPQVGERLTDDERNLLLYDGISTLLIDAGGKARIERMITTYKTNAFGAADTSYLDLTTILTLSYLRYDLRNYILRKYPRHKLANDGTRFGPGQAIVTPKLMKAEIIAKFREWEGIGLVEDITQFKNDLIVERNQGDPNRLDVLLPPNIVNQLIVTAAQIGFVL